MVDIEAISIEPDDILDLLKKNMQLKETCQRIWYQRIINQTAQARGLTVTADEIQSEADRVRSEQRLEKSADTLAWLADQMVTPENWEAGIYDRLLAKKLSECLFADAIEAFFLQNRLNFDQVSLYKIVVPYEQVAQEIFYQVEERETSFYEAAHLYDIDERRRQYCGWEGKLDRWSLEPEIAALIFGSQPGQIIGPIHTDQGFTLLMVESFVAAELTPERRQEIFSQMFNEWLVNELNYRLFSS